MTGFRVPLIALGIAAAAHGRQTPPPQFDPAGLLRKTTALVGDSMAQVPRLACSETVERTFYTMRRPDSSATVLTLAPDIFSESRPDRALACSDRFRLDFAVFQGRQLFSWPGEANLVYESPEDLVSGGASTSGEFGPFALSVFLADSDPDSFLFRGLRGSALGQVADFSYNVPFANSHFSVKMENSRLSTVAYQGSFLADAVTGELRQLVVSISSPPADSGLLLGRIVVDYERRTIGPTSSEVNALLPSSSTMSLVSLQGDLAVNQTRYRDCREFRSESTLRFGDEPTGSIVAGKSGEPRSALPLTKGLDVWTEIVTRIDDRTTFAGDVVEAVVSRPVRVDGRIVVPKKARLAGCVAVLRREFYPIRQAIVQIQFDHVEFDGKRMPISLASVAPGQKLPNIQVATRFATIRFVGTDKMRINRGTEWVWQTQ